MEFLTNKDNEIIHKGDWCFDECVGLVQVQKIENADYIDVYAPFHPQHYWCLKIDDLELFEGKLPSFLKK